MKLYCLRVLSLAWLGLVSSTEATASDRPVSDYKALFAECSAEDCGTRLIVLRAFRQSGERRILTVDPDTLVTAVRASAGLHLTPMPWPRLRESIDADTFGRALRDSENNEAARQDAGIVHTLPPGNGVVLTIDLCPSSHPLDRRLFKTLIEAFLPEEKPVPLGIAITGLWMREHPADLAWLRELEAKEDIAVTWINHSFNHRFAKGVSLSRNFLLQPGTDLRREILATEALMIEQGLRPSVFFRFPGLVSDPALVKRLISFGLVAVGSDAWLAKKEQPTPGSIVLIHGNGNEPYGIKRFLDLVRQERSAIRSRNWLLYDLRESVRFEEHPGR